MGKEIRLYATEWVKEYRSLRWDETDYQELLKHFASYKEEAERPDADEWYVNQYKRYLFLKNYTWDQVVEAMQGDMENEPCFEYEVKDEVGDTFTYRESLSDMIRDCMQEDIWETDIDDCDSDGAEFDWEFGDVK